MVRGHVTRSMIVEGRDVPTFIFLSESEVAQENVDPDDEKILDEKLVLQRIDIQAIMTSSLVIWVKPT